MSCVLGVIARPTSSYTGPVAANLDVIARPISSYTGPAGAIGTSLPDSCLFAGPNHKCMILYDTSVAINSSVPLTFSFLCDSHY